MKIGTTVRYDSPWGCLICTVCGFHRHLVVVFDGTQSYTVRRERLRRGKERADRGKTR